ncbi:MAG: hypothetical protein AAF492_19380 [Verrucomicrobiota bacterium]
MQYIKRSIRDVRQTLWKPEGGKRGVRTGAALLALCLSCWMSPSSTEAATFVVSSLSDSGPGTLRQAMADASASGTDDTITFSLNGLITLTSGSLTYSAAQDLTINGNGPTLTRVSGGNAHQVFFINGNVGDIQIDNLSILNGRTVGGNDGGGLGYTNLSATVSSLTLSNITVTDCSSARNGGGISVNSGGNLTTMVRFHFLNVSNNLAAPGNGGDGGGIFITSDSFGGIPEGIDFEMTDSTIRNNNSEDNGGGIYIRDGVNVIRRCVFYGNASEDQGGAAYVRGTGTEAGLWTFDFINTTFSSNEARTDDGGAMYSTFEATVRLDNCTVYGNVVNVNNRFGGGLWEQQGTLSIHNTILSENFDLAPGLSTDDAGGNDGDIDTEDYNITGIGTVTFAGGPKANDLAVSGAALMMLPILGLNGAANGVKTHMIFGGSPAIDAAELTGVGGTPTGAALATDLIHSNDME